MSLPASVQHNTKVVKVGENLKCPFKDCQKVLISDATMKFHLNYFHAKRKNVHISKNETTQVTEKRFVCPDAHCVLQNKSFKSYASLRQHYLSYHTDKPHLCEKCGKKFAEEEKKNLHEFSCGIKHTCSCGASFSGKRGLLSHLNLSKHECPDAMKEHLFLKSKIERRGRPKRKLKPSVQVNFVKRKFPAPILPKVVRLSHKPFIVSTFDQLLKNSRENRVVQSTQKLGKISRFIIDVIRPSTEGKETSLNGVSSQCIPSNSTMDTLSTALETSKINFTVPSQSNTSNKQDSARSQMSQTDSSAGCQVAQDSSCQTEEFLAWLDIESAKCSSSGLENETAHSSTQTLGLEQNQNLMFFNEIDKETISELSQLPRMTQTETQTDDNWLSDLVHEPLNQVSNAESQTSTAPFSFADFNSNVNFNNNNTINRHSFTESSEMQSTENSYLFNDLSDDACNIHTQTNFFDSMADVTTQTIMLSDVCSDKSSLFNFVSNIETQTECHSENVFSLSSAHTQTYSSPCDNSLLSELLNIETQTDPFSMNSIGLIAAQTQTL